MNELQWDEDLDDLLNKVGSRATAGPNEAHEGEQSLADALTTLAFALPDVDDEIDYVWDESALDRLVLGLSHGLRLPPASPVVRPDPATAAVPGNRLRVRLNGVGKRVRVIVAAVGVVLVAVVALLLNVTGGLSPSTSSPTSETPWRLVSSTTSPFQSLPNGAVSQGSLDANRPLQCVSNAVCYSPGSFTSTSLYVTTDGGHTWTMTSPIPLDKPQLNPLSCSSIGTCAVLGTQTGANGVPVPTFAITTDSGQTWRTSAFPLPRGMANPGYGPLSCTDSIKCIATVATRSPSPVSTTMHTLNGGLTWRQGGTLRGNYGGYAMTCRSNGHCIALTEPSIVRNAPIVAIRTLNWGATWTAGSPLAVQGGLQKVSCGDPAHCLVVIAGGQTYQIDTTSDGGNTWNSSGPPSGWLNFPTAVDCANGKECWIAMSEYNRQQPGYSDPNIEVTHDAGATWSALRLPTHQPAIADVLALSCPPAGDGCIGVGNLEDHFAQGAPAGPLLGPLLLSNLPLTTG